ARERIAYEAAEIEAHRIDDEDMGRARVREASLLRRDVVGIHDETWPTIRSAKRVERIGVRALERSAEVVVGGERSGIIQSGSDCVCQGNVALGEETLECCKGLWSPCSCERDRPAAPRVLWTTDWNPRGHAA